MAHLSCDFSSECLKMATSMQVVLPEKTDLATVKVIYLLHGLMDNCSGWSRYTSVERYAREKTAAIIMPEVQRSFYADMKLGVDYFQFISQELPDVCSRLFGLSQKREQNYIMGLSMGGYGALKCAFTHPRQYAGVAAFSSVTDIAARVKTAEDAHKREFAAIFGPELAVPPECDLLALAESADPREFSPVRLFCGEQDDFYADNERFAAALKKRAFDVSFAHWRGGHEWSFWDEAVKRAISAMI